MKWIIEKAKEIREKYGLVDDLYFVAEKFGAEVIEEPLGGIIKEVYIKDLGIIIIDPNLHPYKKRHLIAHGLAHHLFHRNTKVDYLNNSSDFFQNLKMKRQEREAEVFAAYYLIPEEKLSEILKEEWVKESCDPIPELAEEFQVSENFMKKRLGFKKLFEKAPF